MTNPLNTLWKRLILSAQSGASGSRFAPEPTPSGFVYAGSAAINLLALALPITILQVYDRVLPNASFSTLNALIFGLSAAIIIDLVLKHARSFMINWTGAAYTHNTSVAAMNSILKSPPTERCGAPVATHLDRLSSINSIGDYISSQARIVKIDIMFIPLFALVILIVGGPLLLIPICLFGIFGYFAFRRTEQLRAVVEEREQTDARKNDFLIEVLKSMPTVKSLAMEPSILRRFERLQLASSDVIRRTIILTSAAQTYAAIFASLSTVSIVGFGAILVINGQLTIGGLACCMLLSSQLIQPLIKALSAWNEIQLVGLHRSKVDEIFEQSPAAGVTAEEPPSKKVQRPANISIRGVTIQHGDAAPLFSDLNLELAAGALIALRGSDGCGRTSLLRSLTGALQPKAGSISIGGVTVTPDNCRTIRSAVRYVSQQPVIFRGTILENLTIFGKTPIPHCLWASKLVGLDDEIIKMPLGYDTRLENASGQDIPASTAQRISIARAIAMRPSVLIFDESNTALDLPGEKAFADALVKLTGKMTIVMATHRPSLIRLATQAYEVGNGSLTPITEPAPTKAVA